MPSKKRVSRLKKRRAKVEDKTQRRIAKAVAKGKSLDKQAKIATKGRKKGQRLTTKINTMSRDLGLPLAPTVIGRPNRNQ